jgi:16S rRNA (uracil1498-N3)-methyltransferase
LSKLLTNNGGTETTEIVFCYENEEEYTVKSCLQAAQGKRLVLLIGPEGGFTLEEAAQVQASGGKAVTLGPRILRAETAAVAAVTVAQYENGDLG